MQAVVVRAAKQPLKSEDRPIPTPGRGEVRLAVRACGVCHSDRLVIDALWPALTLPRVPGHEVAGVVDALGEGVDRVKVGDRVGLGWHGGHDGTCDRCLAGQFIHCRNATITGIALDGGYQEFLIAPAVAVAPIPAGLDFAEAAPLLCAGVTTFNALRRTGARPGDRVAVQGLGGLGHLGVQYARAMGFEVTAISRGRDKEEFARRLGATGYLDTESPDYGRQIATLEARVILATAPHAPSIAALLPGLGIGGSLTIVAAPFEPMQVSAIALLSKDAGIQGWSSGTATDSADAMAFAAARGVKPMIERFPLAAAQRAYDAMLRGTVRFRAVIEIN